MRPSAGVSGATASLGFSPGLTLNRVLVRAVLACPFSDSLPQPVAMDRVAPSSGSFISNERTLAALNGR